MKSDLLYNWRIFSDHAHPLRIARIGMRYVNKIPRPAHRPYVRDWLAPTAFIPDAVLNSKDGFVSRVESRYRESYLGIVTVVGTREDGDDFTIYDIDMIVMEPHLPTPKDIHDVIEMLHQDVEDQFLDAHAERLTKYLGGAELDDL